MQGDVGRRAVFARRNSTNWFVGAIAPYDGKFSVSLNFLSKGKKFSATIYSDNPDGKGIKIEQRTVDNRAVLDADILPYGGLAIQLVPLK